MAVTSSKQWIHFLRSPRCPPTSNILKSMPSAGSVSRLIASTNGRLLSSTEMTSVRKRVGTTPAPVVPRLPRQSTLDYEHVGRTVLIAEKSGVADGFDGFWIEGSSDEDDCPHRIGLVDEEIIELADALHGNTILTALSSLRHDPLVEWSRRNAAEDVAGTNESDEAEKELAQIDLQLRGVLQAHGTMPLSVQGQVQHLINVATNIYNLSQMYVWWMPWC